MLAHFLQIAARFEVGREGFVGRERANNSSRHLGTALNRGPDLDIGVAEAIKRGQWQCCASLSGRGVSLRPKKSARTGQTRRTQKASRRSHAELACKKAREKFLEILARVHEGEAPC